MASDVDLSGTWRAAPADDTTRRAYADPEFDDDDWALTTVPGHWRSSPALAGADGPVLHRTVFATPEPFGPGGDAGPDDRRTWLVLDGIFYTSDVWLDGNYLGDTEGYFFPHLFEVTEPLRTAGEHALALEVACPRPTDLSSKRSLTGAFQHSDVLDLDSNPVRIRHSRVRCTDVRDEGAVVALRTVLDTVEARHVDLIASVTPRGVKGDTITYRRTQPLAAGENRVEWSVTIPDPQRWWPHALGDQPMYDVRIAVHADGGALSDEITRPIGLRTVEVRDWVWSVNGERIFLKGANQGPTRTALAEAEPAEIARDVALARDAGLDLLRVHAHISRPELYDAADAAGLLLWQDMPLQWGYSRSVRRQARRQAREAVDLLAHHPSVLVWCGHNLPMSLDVEPDALADTHRRRRLIAKGVAGQVLPSWNRTLLDRTIKSVLESEDGTRPVVAHSGMLPHFPQLEGTDSHLWFGWYHGDERDLPGFLARWPRVGRFVSEFGAQAVPNTDDFVDTSRWPDLDWDHLAHHHGLQKVMFDRYVPPARFATYEDWKDETQRYQARVIRYHIETLRRLKYQPTGGFALFCFADGSPAVTWSVLDHERQPKLGFDALRQACRPVIVVAERPPEHVHPGDHITLDIHAVSDARVAHPTITVRAQLSQGTQELGSWSWRGDLPADSCVRIGSIDFDVPEDTPDTDEPMIIDLHLSGPDLDVSNRYGTWVVHGEHAH
jgi:beta-mannosidase